MHEEVHKLEIWTTYARAWSFVWFSLQWGKKWPNSHIKRCLSYSNKHLQIRISPHSPNDSKWTGLIERTKINKSHLLSQNYQWTAWLLTQKASDESWRYCKRNTKIAWKKYIHNLWTASKDRSEDSQRPLKMWFNAKIVAEGETLDFELGDRNNLESEAWQSSKRLNIFNFDILTIYHSLSLCLQIFFLQNLSCMLHQLFLSI